jgi:hypothetical protein
VAGMTFLTLDDKTECVGFYSNGDLLFGQEPTTSLDKTWKYSGITNKNILYANLFCDGKDYTEVCPEHLQDNWSKLNNQAKAFIRSFIEAKISLKENCFYDLVPRKFLIDFCDIKCQIIDHVIENYPKPVDYNFRRDLSALIYDISFQKISFDEEIIKKNLHDQKVKDFYQKYFNKENYISYNQFHSKTGRLTTEENSFPILNLSKELRAYIKPDGDFLLDIDYNAAEVRVFLALSGYKQPINDVHEWNRVKFGYDDRKTAKNEFISWLYGKKNEREKQFKEFYNSELIKNKYWDGKTVKNYYGKVIEADEFHSVNYIVQSTTAGMALRQVLKVNELLKGHKSKIKMVIHDNIVIDMKKEEKHLIKEIVDMYNNTEFGKFKSSVKIGKTLGDMRKII